MHITQLRNATVVLSFNHDGREVALLIDPMLAGKGTLPALKYLGSPRRRNPLVDLPTEADAVLARCTHALITHCQRGHFDHLDRAGKRFLRERALPVFCMPNDAAHLRERGLAAQPLQASGRQPFFNGHITPVPCLHGEGWVGRLMAHGHGYLIELPGEPRVYVAGDTLLTAEVKQALSSLDPNDAAVLPAGGARFDLGGEILMDEDDVLQACAHTRGQVLANHLEALDHCPGRRDSLLAKAAQGGMAERLRAPRDGETLHFALSA